MSSNPMDRDITRLLSEGQTAARRGDRAMARTLLTQVVDQDPHNEEAWMWLSGVVTDLNEQQICLENALVINPNNEQARRGLEFVAVKTGAAPRVPMAPMPAQQAAVDPAHSPVYNGPSLYDSAAHDMDSVPLETSLSFDGAPDGAGTHPDSFGGSGQQSADEMPQSWATPGPVPPDPFMAAAPYEASGLTNGTNGNGHAAEGAYNDVAATVPYTPAEPGPETPFSGGSAFDTSFGSAPVEGLSHGDDAVSGEVYGSPSEQMSTPMPGENNHTDMPSVPVGGVSFDAQPFAQTMADPAQALGAQSGFLAYEGKLNPSDETVDDLPGWLQSLSPSAPAPSAPPQDDNNFAPFDPSGLSSNPNLSQEMSANDNGSPFGAPADTGNGATDMGPMGPYTDMRMPSPQELPSEDRNSAMPSQPWYLQSSGGNMSPPMPTGGVSSYLDSTMLNSSMVGGSAGAGAAVMDERRPGKDIATIECPNCKEHVPDTSLACPHCRYNYFVNCPHCHELVDTSDAKPGQTAPCPYCKAEINKMELGMGGVKDLVSQKNPGSRPADASSAPGAAFPAMQMTSQVGTSARRGLSFNWVVDLLWLIAIIMMVWALTQLPTWLNLPGLY